MTTQEVMSPADQKVQERIRSQCHWLKYLIKYDSMALAALKECRATKHPHANRDQFLRKYCVSGCIQSSILYRKQDATARLIVYGQLRGKEHTVVKPERWAAQVAQVLADVETETLRPPVLEGAMRVKFEGIDYWNRPVFKQVDGEHRFGSTDLLFTTEEEAKARITADDLIYFGTTFDLDDPEGTLIKKGALTIVQ